MFSEMTIRPFARTSSTAFEMSPPMIEPARTSSRTRGSRTTARTALGELLLADERNRVDRDPLAADVVTVGLGDRAERDLPDLRAAAHDDDALAVDLRERRRQLDGGTPGDVPEALT